MRDGAGIEEDERKGEEGEENGEKEKKGKDCKEGREGNGKGRQGTGIEEERVHHAGKSCETQI